MTAPAVIASGIFSTGAMPTNATPRVAAVVQELPVTAPTSAQMTAMIAKKIAGRSSASHDRGDRPGQVPRADQRPDRQQDEDRAHRRAHATDRRFLDRHGGIAVLVSDDPGEGGAGEQRNLQRPVGGGRAEQHNRQHQQADQHHHRRESIKKRGLTRRPGT